MDKMLVTVWEANANFVRLSNLSSSVAEVLSTPTVLEDVNS